jgi:mannose-6-phosphate isomerase-like protein (cupin superfamily)
MLKISSLFLVTYGLFAETMDYAGDVLEKSEPHDLLICENPIADEASKTALSKDSNYKILECREIQEHITTYRPWGSYTILGEGERYKIKKIVVNPGQILSLQMHFHRSEHWVIVKGTAKVIVDDAEILLREDESIYVPKGSKHRVSNPGKVQLEFIETQVGEYLGEDDIVRFEDAYCRT